MTDSSPDFIMEYLPPVILTLSRRINLRKLGNIADKTVRVIRMLSFPLRVRNNVPRAGGMSHRAPPVWIHKLMDCMDSICSSSKRRPSHRISVGM